MKPADMGILYELNNLWTYTKVESLEKLKQNTLSRDYVNKYGERARTYIWMIEYAKKYTIKDAEWFLKKGKITNQEYELLKLYLEQR